MHASARPGRYNPGVIPRVFAPDAGTTAGGIVALAPDEAAHLTRVLRLGPGAAVRVFDGRGGEWAATIRDGAKSRVSLTLGPPLAPAPEPRVAYSLAIAVLKGDATDEAVRDGVMLGAAAIHPFVAARSEVSLAALARARRADRWRRVAIASAKQCGRATVPVIHEPVTVDALLTGAPGPLRLQLVEPGLGEPSLHLADVPVPSAVTLAVGPEGGWTPGEVAQARAEGWLALGLGGRVLRAVSAPLVALAAAQAVWRDR